ncbi:DUF5979 domain-containing protein [Isoptericola sp. 178]|uniref:DUF5979 domain-containing protein n=1 Tax=Isoptericola sp. 178 TaxID=3064651 RepID=UPI00271283AB|nr:DUF5979 domain-containing protein [Isoptericola sp. 178]MDO8144275.1 DUF5979 domain-containing protein [Isoptericola sp. 178]
MVSISIRRIGAVAAAAIGLSIAAAAPVTADEHLDDSSDPRATVLPGNVNSCAEAGFPDAMELTGETSGNSDGNISATVDTYSGDVDAYQGKTAVNVEITEDGEDAGVVILAVVVKGSNDANLYQAPYLPPDEPSPQNYISPLTDGGQLADVSNWTVCYVFEEEETGSLTVDKVVEASEHAVEVTDPFEITATCTLDEDQVAEETFTFDAEGNPTGDPTISDLPYGTVCVVVETTDTLPAGTEVTYDPTGADTEGVLIDDNEPNVTVTVTNHLPDQEKTGSLTVDKVVEASEHAVEVTDDFEITATCTLDEDQVAEETFTFDAEGNPTGDPTISDLPYGTVCVVVETTDTLPAGTEVTYDPTGADTEGVLIDDNEPNVTVTVTNHLPDQEKTGSLTVDKVVEASEHAVEVTDPFEITATCTLDEDQVAEETFTFDAEGNPTGDPTISDLPYGTVCVVVETTDTLPAGTEVTYDPTGADTEGVLIDDNDPNVTVTVTNRLPDKPKPTPTPTPKPTPTPPTPTPPTVPTAPDLPTTGSDLTLLWVALAVLGLGTGSVLVSRRLRRSS